MTAAFYQREKSSHPDILPDVSLQTRKRKKKWKKNGRHVHVITLSLLRLRSPWPSSARLCFSYSSTWRRERELIRGEFSSMCDGDPETFPAEPILRTFEEDAGFVLAVLVAWLFRLLELWGTSLASVFREPLDFLPSNGEEVKFRANRLPCFWLFSDKESL